MNMLCHFLIVLVLGFCLAGGFCYFIDGFLYGKHKRTHKKLDMLMAEGRDIQIKHVREVLNELIKITPNIDEEKIAALRGGMAKELYHIATQQLEQMKKIFKKEEVEKLEKLLKDAKI